MGKIRLFHGQSLYQSFLNNSYKKYPGLRKSSYISKHNKIFEDGFGWADIWEHNLEKSELFKVKTVITNDEKMQKSWAYDNKMNFKKSNWKKEILLRQIIDFNPDILFAHDVYTISLLIPEIKKRIPSLKLIFGWDGTLMHNMELFKNYDLILSPVQETTEFYSNNGKLSYKFLFGFEPEVLNKIKKRNPLYNCSFIGSLYPEGQHSSRFEMLSKLNEGIDISIWTPSYNYKYWFGYYLNQLERLLKLHFKSFFEVRKFFNKNKGEIFGLEMFQALADSKIVLNKHINQVGNYAANIRLFEVTGSGSCLVTDYKENLNQFFDLENEIVTYKTYDELVDKVKYLLTHEEERKKIAIAGQKRTLTDHSYKKRFTEFIPFFLSLYDAKQSNK